MIRLRLYAFRNKTAEVKCHFHHILSRLPTTNMTYNYRGWTWSPTWDTVCQACFFFEVFIMICMKYVYDSCMGGFVVIFHVYIDCTPVWFILFIILPLYLPPFLKWLWQVSMFHIPTCVESAPTISTLHCLLHFPLCLVPSPSHDFFLHSCPLGYSCPFIVQLVLPWYFTCNYIVLYSPQPSYYSSLPYSP
jgi:hypothetical protein